MRRPELERAVAGLLAVALAAAVAFTRIEAREAVLWDAMPTRADRIAEIVAAAGERTATTALAAVALVVVAGVRRASPSPASFARTSRFRPTTSTAALIIVLAIAVAGDAVVHGRFIATRDSLRASIADQFAEFARLRLPPGDALDAEAFPAHRAPALQITREAIAVNAKGVARIAALENPEGAAHVAEGLGRALAQASVDEAGAIEGDDKGTDPRAHAVDLAVFADREVSSGVLLQLLAIARRGGAKHVDLMLGVGPAPRIPKDAPPEVQVLLPRDAVALPLELVDEGGLPLDPRATIGSGAPASSRSRALAKHRFESTRARPRLAPSADHEATP